MRWDYAPVDMNPVFPGLVYYYYFYYYYYHYYYYHYYYWCKEKMQWLVKKEFQYSSNITLPWIIHSEVIIFMQFKRVFLLKKLTINFNQDRIKKATVVFSIPLSCVISPIIKRLFKNNYQNYPVVTLS